MGFGRHVGGGDDVLIFYGWRERGRDGGRCLWVQYYYLLLRTKNLWSSHQNRRMRRYVRNQRTLSLFYLSTLGTDGCEAVCAQL